MLCNCLECGKSFKSPRGLHGHLKAHKLTVPEYYEQYMPKYSLYSGEQIPYKDREDYLIREFLDKREMHAWLRKVPVLEAKKYIKKKLYYQMKRKKWDHAPCTFDLGTLEIPSMIECERLFGSYLFLYEQMGVKPLFPEVSKKNWLVEDDGGMRIQYDSREKLPFDFKNSFRGKVEVGDYIAVGEDFSSTFVDRKSDTDFAGTVTSKQLPRFKREIQRAIDLDGVLFIVVECSANSLYGNPMIRKYSPPVDYLFHNVRDLLHEFPRKIQFVFCPNREAAKKVTYSILKAGPKLWNVDVQKEVSQWLG